MASIFKRKRRVKLASGKTVVKESRCWYFDSKNESGKPQRVKGFVDKVATLQKAAELERQAARAQVGLTDKYAQHRKRPLSEHLGDFRRSLEAGNTDIHVKVTYSRIKRVFDGCGFRYWCDISASKVKDFLTGLEISKKTFNYYLAAVKQFCRWMVKDRRASESPVDYLSRLRLPENEYRRALDFEEVCRLLAATEKAPTRFGLTGHARAVLYLLAVETGLRVRELQSLKVHSLDLKNCTVTVEPESCKDRRRAVQLLKHGRALQLKKFFAGKMPDVKAFNMPSSYRTAEMLRADLAETEERDKDGKVEKEGISYIDNTGRRADFHCLRHTLATELDRSGASLKERMRIMRHSDRSNLTLGTYGHIQVYDIRRAIENLPEYPWPGTQEEVGAVATGTDGQEISTDEILTGKRTGSPYSDTTMMSSDDSQNIRPEQPLVCMVEKSKTLGVVDLDTIKDPVSFIDSGAKPNGPGRIRTFDQWIMSPLL